MTIEDAKRIPITDWLAGLGYQPAYRRGDNWWYLSMLPDRAEHTPSFKVNTRLNRWIDFGNGEKGNLIDLGVGYHRCSVSEFLRLLAKEPLLIPQQLSQLPLTVAPTNSFIDLKAINELTDPSLLKYLRSRHIPPRIATPWCKEIDYVVRGRSYRAIGFPNQSGGYELRNPWFKGSISPKDSSRIQNGSTELAVFEGFFDFLSYLTRRPQVPQSHPAAKVEPTPDYLILNSTAFWSKNLPGMLRYDRIHLCLDRDSTGQLLTREALDFNPAKFIDHSTAYANFKDLNEYLIRTTARPRLQPSDHPRQRPSLGP